MKTSIRFYNDHEVRVHLTDKNDDREIYMKGIDYSYHYEK